MLAHDAFCYRHPVLEPPALQCRLPRGMVQQRRHRIRIAVPATQQQNVTLLEDSKNTSFLEWAKQSGIKFNRLRPATFQGLRGMMASFDISPDDSLVSVPREMSLTLAPKQRCPFPDFIDSSLWGEAPWFLKLALMILHAKRQGPASSMYKYVQQLPERVDVPVLWSDDQLQALQYPSLIHKVKEQRRSWAALHQQVSAAQRSLESVSQQELFWAMSAVRSRSFSGPYIGSTLRDRLRLGGLVGALVLANQLLGVADLQKSLSAAISVFVFNLMYELILSRSLKQYAMAPVIDLMNHSTASAASVSYDYFQDQYSVVATQAYSKGQQVFISYGTQSNDSLMQYYGFSEPDNPADVYVTTNLLKWLEQLQPISQQRLDLLNSAGLLASLQEVALEQSGFPAQTLQALRFLLAEDADASKGPAAFASMQGASSALEQKVALVLVHACQQELAHLGSSLEEDQVLLAKKRLSSTEAAAVQFRIEKKKLLAGLLAKLTQ